MAKTENYCLICQNVLERHINCIMRPTEIKWKNGEKLQTDKLRRSNAVVVQIASRGPTWTTQSICHWMKRFKH